MAMKKPVVAPRVPGVVEVAKDGIHVLLYDPSSPLDLAKKILKLAGDPSLRESIAVNASKLVKKYTYRYRAYRIVKVIRCTCLAHA